MVQVHGYETIVNARFIEGTERVIDYIGAASHSGICWVKFGLNQNSADLL